MAPTKDDNLSEHQRRFLDARAEVERQHQEWVDVRFRQQDRKEKFTSGAEPRRGRGGYG
ncbi:MAG TPA: hypothetical protein VK504_01350 [Vicinamibacterales bacterium]|nr:hypothetical protein [Vicinamibacterales bacterium]